MPVLAIGAVEAVLLIAALFAILLLWAGNFVFQLIGNVLRHAPFIGGWLSSNISDLLEGALQAAVGTWDGLTQPVAHFFWMLGTGIWHLMYGLVGTIGGVASTAGAALGIAQGAANAIAPAVGAGVQAAEGYANGVANTAQNAAIGVAQNLYNQAIAHADTVGAEVQADAEALAADAVGTAQNLYNQAIAHADTVGAEVDADAHTLYDQAVGVAQGLYNQALAYTNTVSGELFQDIQDVQGEAQDLYNQAITVAPALALAQVLPRVAALEAEATECLEPLCESVTPNAPSLGRLGQFLSNLETLGVDALFVALAAEALTNPEAVVQDISTVVTDVGEPIFQGFRDLIGA